MGVVHVVVGVVQVVVGVVHAVVGVVHAVVDMVVFFYNKNVDAIINIAYMIFQ